jgi:hypothetical protein
MKQVSQGTNQIVKKGNIPLLTYLRGTPDREREERLLGAPNGLWYGF